jgi:DNA-binding LytR/AlgR family response regulator
MENKHPIRCIVVDDEHPAIRLLSSYIKKIPNMQLVLRTTEAAEAIQAIGNGMADLVFMDIQMPKVTGMEMLELIKDSGIMVILTTAYSTYAVKGYEHDVVDYLLKPITFDRFLLAVSKAQLRIEAKLATTYNGHLMLKTAYKVIRVEFDTILYIEGLGDYVICHTTSGRITTLERLKQMEAVLPDTSFIRIHKSYIVNMKKISYFEKGKFVIAGEHLPIGETYRSTVKAKFGHS